jgi:hypothetical protein
MTAGWSFLEWPDGSCRRCPLKISEQRSKNRGRCLRPRVVGFFDEAKTGWLEHRARWVLEPGDLHPGVGG